MNASQPRSSSGDAAGPHWSPPNITGHHRTSPYVTRHHYCHPPFADQRHHDRAAAGVAGPQLSERKGAMSAEPAWRRSNSHYTDIGMYSRSKKYVPPTWFTHSRQIGTLAESPPRTGAPETWCSPRSSPATCPGSHTDRAIKRACGEGFWRAIFGSTCWPRFVVRLPVSVTTRLNPRQGKQGEGWGLCNTVGFRECLACLARGWCDTHGFFGNNSPDYLSNTQRRNFLQNVGVVSNVSCSFYPCNAHRRNVKFLESWGCTYNPTLH